MMKPNQPLTIPSNLIHTVQTLSTSLSAIQPVSLANSETTQLITYALMATAVVGILVYHYIKNQETL